MTATFLHVETREPHRSRARAIIASHPEVRELLGRNPFTAAIAVGVVALQVGIAAALALLAAPWWLTVLLAWLVGAFAHHALYAIFHEVCHQLVFRSRTANRVLGLISNLPFLAPVVITYGHYHLLHHRHQGDPERDPDLPGSWEARWFSRSWLHKLIWQLLFPFVQILRTHRHGDPAGTLRNPWVAANALAQVAFVALIALTLGGTALLYLGLSTYFLFALHPIAARFIQEHHVVAGEQETYSYYGPLNPISLNLGYHNEHHDFPFVAWNRLPKLTETAGEVYGALHAHRSWAALWLRFLRDRSLTLYSRVVRRAGTRPRR